MDVLAVREAVTEHIRIAREEERPTLVEAFTYRFRGHSAADPEVYRSKEEVEEWRAKDPIETFAKRAVEEDRLKESDLEEIRERAEKVVLEAVEFADNSPEPALESLYEHLYVLGESLGWYTVDERSPDPHPGEREPEASARAKKLAEAGAAHAGQPSSRRHDPAQEGDANEGEAPTDTDEVAAEQEDAEEREEGG